MKPLQEDIYSSQTRKFIRIAKKIEQREFSDISKRDDLRRKANLIYNYLEKNFRRLGELGTVRSAFASDSGEVIKVINPGSGEAGLRQNMTEIIEFNRHDISVFPRVEEASPIGIWFVVEKVIPLRSMSTGRQEKVLSHLFPKLDRFLNEVWDYQIQKSPNMMASIMRTIMEMFEPTMGPSYDPEQDEFRSEKAKRFYYFLEKSPWFEKSKENINKLQDYLNNPDKNLQLAIHAFKSTDLPMDDFHTGNFGIDDDGNLKIIDIGF